MDTAAIVALINFGALVFAIYKFDQDRKDTKEQLAQQSQDTRELAQLTNKLQQDYHRLSVQLDQSLQRLHRANDVLREYHQSFAKMCSVYPGPEEQSNGQMNSDT